MFGASPGAMAKPTTPDRGQAKELVAVVRPPSPKVDWSKPIFEYLQLGTIPDDETETRRLALRAKGYLIHDNELYRHSTLGIL
jgi:hypothetical protein